MFSVLSLTRAGGGASQLDRELSRLTTEAEHAAAQLGETRERLVTAEALASELHFATQSAELVEEKTARGASRKRSTKEVAALAQHVVKFETTAHARG